MNGLKDMNQTEWKDIKLSALLNLQVKNKIYLVDKNMDLAW